MQEVLSVGLNTRAVSGKQEKKVASILGGKRTSNSGATLFDKGDVTAEHLLIECKTVMENKKSFTVKKEWLEKTQEEAFSRGKQLSALCFNFGSGSNYFVVREDDFKSLYESWLWIIKNIEGEI